MLSDIALFSKIGHFFELLLLTAAIGAGGLGIFSFGRTRPRIEQWAGILHGITGLLFLVGFLLLCWLHYVIHQQFSLTLPVDVAAWINQQLAQSSAGSAYGLPPYDPARPPRYSIPMWIENEKYYFWFMCYALLSLVAYRRTASRRLRAVLHIFLAAQVIILFWLADPFSEPLPRFFAEIRPWQEAVEPFQQAGLFMRLYPKMVFYYNAHYMWLHPPLLFVAYGCITLTFIASLFMLTGREAAYEALGYDFAKLGYFVLTLGMLLGYPWALQAWGPNWWWDPKICSSIMMWVVFSGYLHTRLYASKPAMWYFSALLGMLSFVAMIFTFLATFYFPGEHTMQ